MLYNLISFSDAFSSGLVNLTLLPCGSSYGLSNAGDPRPQHSCTDVRLRPDVTSTYFLPWVSPEKAEKYQGSWGGHPPPEVMPRHLKLPLTSSSVGLDFSHTHSTQVPPTWQWPHNIWHLSATDACNDVSEYYVLVHAALWGFWAIYLISCCWIQLYPEISAQPKCYSCIS